MSLELINSAGVAEAKHMFRQCCTAETWVTRMVDSRPYGNAEALHGAADSNWRGLAEADYLEAFEGHPRIGDVSSLKEKYRNTKALAAGEQSSVNAASDAVIKRLAQGNTDYADKFGFIFIVCATGKSALEMTELLEARLPNDRDTELRNAAEEQRKILHLRLEKLL